MGTISWERVSLICLITRQIRGTLCLRKGWVNVVHAVCVGFSIGCGHYGNGRGFAHSIHRLDLLGPRSDFILLWWVLSWQQHQQFRFLRCLQELGSIWGQQEPIKLKHSSFLRQSYRSITVPLRWGRDLLLFSLDFYFCTVARAAMTRIKIQVRHV